MSNEAATAGLSTEVRPPASMVPTSSASVCQRTSLRASDTPTRFQGLPVALWRLDQLSWYRTLFASEQVSPSTREHVRWRSASCT
jgi:hypothetical protein